MCAGSCAQFVDLPRLCDIGGISGPRDGIDISFHYAINHQASDPVLPLGARANYILDNAQLLLSTS